MLRPLRLRVSVLALALTAACAGGDNATTGDSTSTSTTSTSVGAGESSTTDATGTASEATSEATTAGTTVEPTTSSSTDPTTDDTTSTTTDPTTGGPVCGNGVQEEGEACDDGQETVSCDGDCSGPAVCGDAYTNAAAGEICDDGNAFDDDACLSDCTPASCGDGFLQDGVEECDDGNDKNGDGCSASCKTEKGCGEAFSASEYCLMELDGELPQYTRCTEINDGGTECILPRIRYGSQEGVNDRGYPVRWMDINFMNMALTQWCQSLGFSGFADVEYGDRPCFKPAGPVKWSKCCDENEWHFIEHESDNLWYPPSKLNDDNVMCPEGDVIISVTCMP